MNENIQALLQKVAESEELQSRFAKVSTPEQAYEIAKEIQGGYTKEEFLEAAKALAEAMDEDISDEELASAAGGLDESVLDPAVVKGFPKLTREPESITGRPGGVSKSVMTNPALTPRLQSKASQALAV